MSTADERATPQAVPAPVFHQPVAHREARTSLLRAILVGGVLAIVLVPGPGLCADVAEQELADIGRALFFNTGLSQNGSLACASCHDPGRAFTDGRDNGVDGAVSLGADGRSLGDRNAPTTTYAFLAPRFQRADDGHYVGGFFHDGRAATMEVQAREPFFNPLEMALPDEAALARRVRDNTQYAKMFRKHFGDAVFGDDRRLTDAVARGLSAFERTALFAPFDSKYDRYLRGDYSMTALESRGRDLFFSPMTNCTACHLANTAVIDSRETFTNYRYHNIGIPANATVRQKNGLGPDYRDPGVLAQADEPDPGLAGRFKVPTLRNVAVTGPYMHNGVFRELRTAILFYNKYTVISEKSQTNPETGRRWGAPEVEASVDLDQLREGQPIDRDRLDALIAFLKTLTDRRYEPLLGE